MARQSISFSNHNSGYQLAEILIKFDASHYCGDAGIFICWRGERLNLTISINYLHPESGSSSTSLRKLLISRLSNLKSGSLSISAFVSFPDHKTIISTEQ